MWINSIITSNAPIIFNSKLTILSLIYRFHEIERKFKTYQNIWQAGIKFRSIPYNPIQYIPIKFNIKFKIFDISNPIKIQNWTKIKRNIPRIKRLIKPFKILSSVRNKKELKKSNPIQSIPSLKKETIFF